MSTINIYSDETNHLKDPEQGNFMVIGSMWCEKRLVKEISDSIRKVKEYHGFNKRSEVKWTKISRGNQGFYEDLVKIFFETEGINFRAIVVPKDELHHEIFQQTDEDFYYKMQYTMITNIVRGNKPASFNIYIDYKDIWSNVRSQKLKGYLENKLGFGDCSFTAQPVRSYESELMQMADIFIGATSYRSNRFSDLIDTPKSHIVRMIEKRSLQRLNQGSPVTADKINVFMWAPRKG